MECPYCTAEKPILVSAWETAPIVTGVPLIRDKLIMSVAISGVKVQTGVTVNFCPVCGRNLREKLFYRASSFYISQKLHLL